MGSGHKKKRKRFKYSCDSSDEKRNELPSGSSKRRRREKFNSKKRSREEEEKYFTAEEDLSLPFLTAKDHFSSESQECAEKEKTSRRGIKKSRIEKSEAPAGVRGTEPGSSSATTSFSVESFIFHKIIGQGSFGNVLLASDVACGQKRAVKIVGKETAMETSEEGVPIEEKVLQIARGSSFLLHAQGSFQTADFIFYVMEYMGGGNLEELLAGNAPFNIHTTRFIAAEIVCGLKFLHENGVIHRDLKPANIMLDCEGHIKLSDFGLAATNVFGEDTTSEMVGTLRYMAPEVIRQQCYTSAVDWFAFAIICFEMASGNYPFYTGKGKAKLVHSLLNEEPSYPEDLNPDLFDLLLSLFYKNAYYRTAFGSSKIKDHQFFSPIDWVNLEGRKICPPFLMEPEPELDCRETIAVDELLLWMQKRNY
ncbi:serine/threonine-protein kinase Sgk2-like [Mixophyes fleayi]|uniref:serine/threonine-protein kinase Sgk2-like n=1 Tax=Mixophyes fleayi TaxID=3061075 RepID=UPI003F4D9C2F